MKRSLALTMAVVIACSSPNGLPIAYDGLTDLRLVRVTEWQH